MATGNQTISAQTPLSVLIVEDEPISALFLQEMIARSGMKVAGVVATGEEALKFFYLDPKPNLVLMDFMLSGPMTGAQAAEYIDKHFQIPVIVVSAHPEKAISGQFKQPDHFAFIQKPVEQEHLLQAIRQLAVA